MSYAIAETQTHEDEPNKSLLLQIGFFLLLFSALTLIGDATSAYAPSCTGVANLTGPLLPTMV